jgi:hypothetical protein
MLQGHFNSGPCSSDPLEGRNDRPRALRACEEAGKKEQPAGSAKSPKRVVIQRKLQVHIVAPEPVPMEVSRSRGQCIPAPSARTQRVVFHLQQSVVAIDERKVTLKNGHAIDQQRSRRQNRFPVLSSSVVGRCSQMWTYQPSRGRLSDGSTGAPQREDCAATGKPERCSRKGGRNCGGHIVFACWQKLSWGPPRDDGLSALTVTQPHNIVGASFQRIHLPAYASRVGSNGIKPIEQRRRPARTVSNWRHKQAQFVDLPRATSCR